VSHVEGWAHHILRGEMRELVGRNGLGEGLGVVQAEIESGEHVICVCHD
jgi:hypothetical protein